MNINKLNTKEHEIGALVFFTVPVREMAGKRQIEFGTVLEHYAHGIARAMAEQWGEVGL